MHDISLNPCRMKRRLSTETTRRNKTDFILVFHGVPPDTLGALKQNSWLPVHVKWKRIYLNLQRWCQIQYHDCRILLALNIILLKIAIILLDFFFVCMVNTVHWYKFLTFNRKFILKLILRASSNLVPSSGDGSTMLVPCKLEPLSHFKIRDVEPKCSLIDSWSSLNHFSSSKLNVNQKILIML